MLLLIFKNNKKCQRLASDYDVITPLVLPSDYDVITPIDCRQHKLFRINRRSGL